MDDKWQTMNTAPRDGSWVLLCSRKYHPDGYHITIAQADYGGSEPLRWRDHNGFYGIRGLRWMPLPSLPTDLPAPRDDD